MKKNKVLSGIIIAIVICLFISPISVFAKTYYIGMTDMSLSIDNTEWHVFTRTNLDGNPSLEELEITEDWVLNFMTKNTAYLYAIHLNDNDMNSSIELIVRKTVTDEIDNLSKYSRNDVMEFAETMAKKQNAEIYDVYENDYKFTYLNYESIGYNIIEYLTVVNGDIYTITIQKIADFTNSDRSEIKNIIDNINFDVEEQLNELPTVEDNEESGFANEIIDAAIKGVIIGGIVGVVSIVINIFARKNKE